MLYPSRDSGIQYRGIRNASYMIRFLHNVMNPIVRITRTEQLMELLVNYDVSVKKRWDRDYSPEEKDWQFLVVITGCDGRLF